MYSKNVILFYCTLYLFCFILQAVSNVLSTTFFMVFRLLLCKNVI